MAASRLRLLVHSEAGLVRLVRVRARVLSSCAGDHLNWPSVTVYPDCPAVYADMSASVGRGPASRERRHTHHKSSNTARPMRLDADNVKEWSPSSLHPTCDLLI